MDLLDEALDLERRAGGDLVLIERQLVAALLVAEINLHDAARNEPAADEQHGDQEIFPHEPAAYRDVQGNICNFSSRLAGSSSS